MTYDPKKPPHLWDNPIPPWKDTPQKRRLKALADRMRQEQAELELLRELAETVRIYVKTDHSVVTVEAFAKMKRLTRRWRRTPHPSPKEEP